MLFYLLAAGIGGMLSVKSAVNGELTAISGVYTASLIIYIMGFGLAGGYCLLKRVPVKPVRISPFWYTSGLWAILITLCNNLAYGRISLAAIVALCLLGQVLTSLVLDAFGWIGVKKRRLLPGQFIGVALVLAGIWVMFRGVVLDGSALWGILLSFAMGVFTVVNRVMNAGLAGYTTGWTSTFYNYAGGLIAALIVLPLSGEGLLWPQLTLGNCWVLLGGVMGAVIVLLSNLAAANMPAFEMTLLIFVGQVFAGVAVDAITAGSFSLVKLLGGVFALAGLAVNEYVLHKGGAHPVKNKTNT